MRNVVPVGVKLVSMEDGPYQKQEERAIGGACKTGDAAFDAAFLAYGTPGDVQAIAPAVRAACVGCHLRFVAVEPRRVVAPLELDPELATTTFEVLLAFAAALDGSSGDDPQTSR